MCPGFPRGRPATGSLINEIVLGEESDVGSLAQRQTAVLQPFVLYLDRHIELDEHHHGPMALEMLAELCGDEVQRWDQATDAAVLALSARLTLWSTVMSEVTLARMRVPHRLLA
jgi:hypothetical protein